MCGIVGIFGREPVAAHLVDALKRLEYRGYDSAGVATLEHGKLAPPRARQAEGAGRRLTKEPLAGNIGIGHTRWATHGKPSENNAHPHATERVAVVHNGIIENFRELREKLGKNGHKFGSETDTEVVAHLVTDEMNNGRTPAQAVAAALKQLRGAFALAFMFAGEDDLMIGARKGSPLAVGYGKGEMYLGSDAIALAPFTDQVSYLEDGDWAVVTRKGVGSRRARQKGRAADHHVGGLGHAGRQGQLQALHGEGNPRAAGSGRPHARALHRHDDGARAAAGRIAVRLEEAQAHVDLGLRHRLLCRAGGEILVRTVRQIAVEIDIASEFRYREAPMEEGDLAIFISQSGETADTLASLRYAKEHKQHVLSVVNVPTSTIARDSDVVMPTLAGPEIGVASTKAFTCQLAVLACLAIAAGARAASCRRRTSRSWCTR